MDQASLYKQQFRAAAGVDLLLLALLILASFAISEQRAMFDGLPTGFAASPVDPVANAVFSQDKVTGGPGGGGVPGITGRRYAGIPTGGVGGTDGVGGPVGQTGLTGGGVPVQLADGSALPLSQAGGGAPIGVGGGGTGGNGGGGGIGGPGGLPGGGLGGGGGGGGTVINPDEPPITAVPEPSSWILMVLAVGMVGGILRRARRIARAAVTADA